MRIENWELRNPGRAACSNGGMMPVLGCREKSQRPSIRELAMRALALVLVMMLPVLLGGCGGGTGVGGTLGSAETRTFEGWSAYKSGANAEQHFKDAIALDPSFSDAYNGLGWVSFKKAGQQASESQQAQLLREAETRFKQATESNPLNTDAWVGLSGVHLAQNNWAGARDAAITALEQNNRYFSSHDNIDYQDVILILAQACFFLGEYDKVIDHLEELSPGYRTFYAENQLTPPDLIRKIQELQAL